MKKNNKITTNGYFVRRLRDSGFVVIRIYSKYGQHDPRKWTVMVDPGGTSVLITCYQNQDYKGDVSFVFDDGRVSFPPSYRLKTQSMEVIVMTLLEKNISQKKEGGMFEKKSDMDFRDDGI